MVLESADRFPLERLFHLASTRLFVEVDACADRLIDRVQSDGAMVVTACRALHRNDVGVRGAKRLVILVEQRRVFRLVRHPFRHRLIDRQMRVVAREALSAVRVAVASRRAFRGHHGVAGEGTIGLDPLATDGENFLHFAIFSLR